jgi:hypothetical protein
MAASPSGGVIERGTDLRPRTTATDPPSRGHLIATVRARDHDEGIQAARSDGPREGRLGVGVGRDPSAGERRQIPQMR